MTINTMHNPLGYGPWLYKILLYLGWFTTCGVIAIAQGQYDCVWYILLGPIQSLLQHQGAAHIASTLCTPIVRVPWEAKIWSIWCGWSCVVPLPWLKANVMVLEHPSGTYIKCVATPWSNGWAHMTLNIMHHPPGYGPWLWALTMQKSYLYGVGEDMWCYCHSSRPV